MYKMIYYSRFKDLNEHEYRIEIYKDTEDSLSPKGLILSDTPVVITYKGDDIYKPLKQSSCSINVLTDDVLRELYTGKLDEVKLKVLKDGELFWVGFLTPNVYNSEYNSEFDLLTLEFIDTIAQLENTKFQKSDNKISTFMAVMDRVLKVVDKDRDIKKILLQSSISLNDSDDILNKLFIQERNFFDEEDEPETNKSVLEDILTYLGMSMVQYKDAFFILDYDAVTKGNFLFVEYDLVAGVSKVKTIEKDERFLSDIGVYEANGNISLGDVFNKVSVIAVNNPIKDILRGLFDESTLTNQNKDPNKYYSTDTGEEVYFSAYFNSSAWDNMKPVISSFQDQTIQEVTDQNVNEITSGSFFQKNDKYTKADGEPSSLNWVDSFTMKRASDMDFGSKEFKALSAKVDYVIYKGGYFIIDFKYLFNNSNFSNKTDEDKDVVYTNDKFTTSFHDTKFMCKLKIGDSYYTGEGWKSWTKDYLPNKDFFDNAIIGVEVHGSERKYYYIYKGGKKYIGEEEARRIEAKDRFFLVHKNNINDPIYNTWKNLTNQVSYKENLVDSQNGVLIKLPQGVIDGELEFELYAPNDLGEYANGRTTGAGKYNTFVQYCHVKDLALVYTNNKFYIDIFNRKEYDPDILYTNEIEKGFVSEKDDIELRINTYTEKASSYSYVICKTIDGYDFVEKVYNKNYSKAMKMEESIIAKNVERYSVPKYIYTNTVNNKDIKPYTVVKLMDRRFVVNSISYDLSADAAEITAVEL